MEMDRTQVAQTVEITLTLVMGYLANLEEVWNEKLLGSPSVTLGFEPPVI